MSKNKNCPYTKVLNRLKILESQVEAAIELDKKNNKESQ